MQTNETNSQVNFDVKSLVKIMVTTDNHIGFLEHDQIRGNDSFKSFEEVLIKAKAEGVDFILHGGDLFHHHNPSKKTIIRTSHILQKHIFGHKTHEFQTYCYKPNYTNENLSIELPIFIIHGNHDDPSGLENFSSIDIYSGKEVNYFGKIYNYEEFEMYPILFVKGSTKIAVYGIGNIKDERLYIALQNKKVNFNRPEDHKCWFNIFVVHQNRFRGHYAQKARKNYLPENFIPSFIDLVIWGHEHECFTEAIQNSEIGLHIYQPGSSVATSLIGAESKMKHVGIVEVYQNSFRIIPVKLETCRPFIYDTFELREKNIKNSDDIENFIVDKLEEALRQAAEQVNEIIEKSSPDIKQLIGLPNDTNFSLLNHDIYQPLPILPLIRLKIETSGHIVSRTNIIVSRFGGLIANPHDVLQFYKRTETMRYKNKNSTKMKGSLLSDFDTENNSTTVNLDDEIVDWDDEIKRFLSSSIQEEFSSGLHKSYMFPEIFLDVLDKHANGHDKKAIENLFTNFYNKLTFSSGLQSAPINWNYIRDFKLDDSNLAKKENHKHVDEILKGSNFTFYNDKLNSTSGFTIEDDAFMKREDEPARPTNKIEIDEYSFENSMFNNVSAQHVKRDSRKARGNKTKRNSGNTSSSDSEFPKDGEAGLNSSKNQTSQYASKKSSNFPISKPSQVVTANQSNLILSNNSASTMLNNMQITKPQLNFDSNNLIESAFQDSSSTIYQNDQRYICNKKNFIGQFGQNKNSVSMLQKTQNSNFDLDSLLNDPENSGVSQLKKKSAGNAKGFKIKK